MKKIKFYCYECEQEYILTTESTEQPKHCPFCGKPLDTADRDIEEE